MKPPGRFTLFRSVIGQLSTNQNTKLKPIIPWSPAFSRLKCSLLVSLWPLIGSLGFHFGLGFGFATLNRKASLTIDLKFIGYNMAHEQWHICILKVIIFKGYFHPWCNARCDLISCNAKFSVRLLKTFQNRLLKSHPGHTVNYFTVNIFAVRHFIVILQHCEFC